MGHHYYQFPYSDHCEILPSLLTSQDVISTIFCNTALIATDDPGSCLRCDKRHMEAGMGASKVPLCPCRETELVWGQNWSASSLPSEGLLGVPGFSLRAAPASLIRPHAPDVGTTGSPSHRCEVRLRSTKKHAASKWSRQGCSFVPSACSNKVPPAWLKTTQVCSPTFLEARSPKVKVW